jgi:hypothetical protein
MWLLFVPLAICFAVLLSIGLLVAGVVSILGWGWPWLLIGLGIWMFVHEDGRHRRARQWKTAGGSGAMRDWPKDKRQLSNQSERPAAAGSGKASARSGAASSSSSKSNLPADLQFKVELISRKAEALEAQADRFPPFSQDLYLVRQTQSDYLPRTLDTYLSMPRDSVDRPMAPGGKTPHQELKAQLDLLDTKLDEITRDVERQNNERLMANRKFLQDRFDLRNETSGASPFKADSA